MVDSKVTPVDTITQTMVNFATLIQAIEAPLSNNSPSLIHLNNTNYIHTVIRHIPAGTGTSLFRHIYVSRYIIFTSFLSPKRRDFLRQPKRVEDVT